jgi:hypothetical protein
MAELALAFPQWSHQPFDPASHTFASVSSEGEVMSNLAEPYLLDAVGIERGRVAGQ